MSYQIENRSLGRWVDGEYVSRRSAIGKAEAWSKQSGHTLWVWHWDDGTQRFHRVVHVADPARRKAITEGTK